jgi:hypothetical protein
MEEQKQVIEQRAELEKRLAMIALTGEPESKADLELLFALGTGAIQPPKGVLYDPSTWSDIPGMMERTGEGRQNALARGLFNRNGNPWGPQQQNFDKMPFNALQADAKDGTAWGLAPRSNSAASTAYLMGSLRQ